MTLQPDESPNRVSPGQPSREPLEKAASSGKSAGDFQSHMEGSKTGQGQGTGAEKASGPPTPMSMTGSPAISSSPVSFDTLLAQGSQAQDSLGTVEEQLNKVRKEKLPLKRSQSHLVRQKLGEASNYIRSAGSKLGLKLSEGKMPAGISGVARFIAMLNDGQVQLAQVQEQLKKMASSGKQINPGEMMSVQVKMGLAQQEIEYTSTLLGKVIQSVTQLMNTQL